MSIRHVMDVHVSTPCHGCPCLYAMSWMSMSLRHVMDVHVSTPLLQVKWIYSFIQLFFVYFPDEPVAKPVHNITKLMHADSNVNKLTARIRYLRDSFSPFKHSVNKFLQCQNSYPLKIELAQKEEDHQTERCPMEPPQKWVG